MDGPKTVEGLDDRTSRKVFVSYATPNQKQALSVCKSIEARGIPCWISTRDVAPGDNYQEAIVQAIRDARAVVLVFSSAANGSDEIKKELSLASRYRVPVIALRIEDIEPSDAFAYELSTRQWIDAFGGWDKAIGALAARLGQMAEASSAPSAAASLPVGATRWRPSTALVPSTLLLLFLASAGVWWWLRPAAAPAHAMAVRLAGFQLLSPTLPATLRESVNAEISAAFNADGVVGVSTAPTAPPGKEPAYAVGGTILQDSGGVRVITQLINERSGATVWTNTFNYDVREVARIPRHIAVDAGNVIRCGLFGATTYRKPLPDTVLRDYMHFCEYHWDPNSGEGRKALVPAERVVAAVPDFSWGWAAVAGAYWKIWRAADTEEAAEQARATGRQAADRGIALDARNSEALYIKSMLVTRHDWIAREDLLKRAIAARRLDCGCEFHQYGWMLANVGRVTDAVEQMRRANDMLALYIYTPLTLAEGLVEAGKIEESKPYYDAAIDLAPNAQFAGYMATAKAIGTRDIKALQDPALPLSAAQRAAFSNGFRAAASGDAGAKASAARALLALPEDQQDDGVALLLGALGANQDAFRIALKLSQKEYPGPSIFWFPAMRGTLSNPAFPAAARQLGLMKYWKTKRTKPDVCAEKAPPAFCVMI